MWNNGERHDNIFTSDFLVCVTFKSQQTEDTAVGSLSFAPDASALKAGSILMF